MRFTRLTLRKHAYGCLRQYTVEWIGRHNHLRSVRLAIGGMGNVPVSAGPWTILPRIWYHHCIKRVYLHWFSAILSFSPNSYGIDYWIQRNPDGTVNHQ